MNTGTVVSPTRGIVLRKAIGVYRLKEKDKATFLTMKKKYEERYTELKITENSFEMINDFRDKIDRQNIKLDKEDLGHRFQDRSNT